MTRDQLNSVIRVMGALNDTVIECGDEGCPAGPMYAALMGVMSLDRFTMLMGLLVKAGRVRYSGHVYYAVKK